MEGGGGHDTYTVDNAGDQVIEANVAGSSDLVNSSVSFSIASQFVENLTLTGGAAINATGNKLNNVLTGNTGEQHAHRRARQRHAEWRRRRRYDGGRRRE